MKAELELEVEAAMGDCKRVAVMTAASNAGCMSKRRRISGSSASLSDLGDRCLWLDNATTSLSRLEKKNSLGIIAGGEMRDVFLEDEFPVSCSSGNDCGKATVAKDAAKFEDLEVNCKFLLKECTLFFVCVWLFFISWNLEFHFMFLCF